MIIPPQAQKSSVPTETSLIRLDAFQQALAEAKTISEVKDLRDKAEIFKTWLKRRHASRQDKNAIAEMQLRAERKLGLLIPSEYPHGGNRKSESNLDNQSLIQSGISYFQSHWWQLAEVRLHNDNSTPLD